MTREELIKGLDKLAAMFEETKDNRAVKLLDEAMTALRCEEAMVKSLAGELKDELDAAELAGDAIESERDQLRTAILSAAEAIIDGRRQLALEILDMAVRGIRRDIGMPDWDNFTQHKPCPTCGMVCRVGE